MALIRDEHQSEIRNLLKASALFLLERQERNGKKYPFIDTKFDIGTGRDFGPESESFRQKDHIYGWIQGRGLEALAGTADYFEQSGETAFAKRFDRVLALLTESLEQIRRENGRLAFCMDVRGRSRFPQRNEHNYTDLFYAKGLLAAGKRLKNTSLANTGADLLNEVIASILNRTFCSDQHMFDPSNRGGHAEGKFSQGPMMIALGGTALAGNLSAGARLTVRILETHLNHGQFPELQEFDFVEAVDKDNRPWQEADGAILCDPGHTLEFIGLACKNLMMQGNPEIEAVSSLAGKYLVKLFLGTFDLGFQPRSGILKSYDLRHRRPLDQNSPWWSLPEAVRAAALLNKLYPSAEDELRKKTEKMLDNFFGVFVKQGSHGFACQTCGCSGEMIRVIPALPDADPLYHTNLALIEAIRNQ